MSNRTFAIPLVAALAIVGGSSSGLAQKGVAACLGQGSTSAQQMACLEQQRTKAFQEVIAKTNAFIAVSGVSCPNNVYQDWRESLKPLGLIANLAADKGSTFASLVRQVDLNLLEARLAVADAALRNGGRFCRKYADAEYRQVLNDYRDPAFAFARDRAKVGIDDVRALPKIDD